MNKVSKKDIQEIKALDGIFRKTLAYNKNLMLCHFYLEKNSEIPLHSHKQHQVGYVIRGKLRFFTDKSEFIAEAGDSYIFNSNEKHGAFILEDSEVIDVFNPVRNDYK
jgi:quercetin dioxygenase-like cupin family protein